MIRGNLALDSHDEPRHPTLEANDQADEAIEVVERPAEAFLHLPFRDLDRIIGGIPEGEIWNVAAFSGHGKTTFLMSLLDRWFNLGKKIYYMGLESKPKTLRVHWACKRLGLDAGLVLTGALNRDPMGREKTQAIKDEIKKQVSQGNTHKIRFSPARSIGVVELTRACEEAADMEADVLFIDHIDHICGDGVNLHAESVAIHNRLLELAHDFELRVIASTQLNNEMVKGSRVAMYQPPQPHHIYMGSHKRNVASGQIGLFRPLKLSGVDKEVLAKFNAGQLEPKEVLEPNTMGVVILKHRNIGNDGKKCYLGVENGRVVDMRDADLPSGLTERELGRYC